MESDHPEHLVPLHPWEGRAGTPTDTEDSSWQGDDVDPVGPGPLADEAAMSRASALSASPHRQPTPASGAELAQALYGAGQSTEQVIAALRDLRTTRPDLPAMATRLSSDVLEAVRLEFPSALVHPDARACVLGELAPPRGQVCVVAAGRADAGVAHEAAVSARVFGAESEVITDVGPAELQELTDDAKRLTEADCLIVVSGMEGSLPSSVSWRTGLPVVAVPTSVGYGSAFGGMAALLAMLNACAPGVVVCNIDNGFGAGVFAARVARAAHPEIPIVVPVSAG